MENRYQISDKMKSVYAWKECPKQDVKSISKSGDSLYTEGQLSMRCWNPSSIRKGLCSEGRAAWSKVSETKWGGEGVKKEWAWTSTVYKEGAK